jgi:hypothetical protein
MSRFKHEIGIFDPTNFTYDYRGARLNLLPAYAPATAGSFITLPFIGEYMWIVLALISVYFVLAFAFTWMIRHHERYGMTNTQWDTYVNLEYSIAFNPAIKSSIPKDYYSIIKKANHNTAREWYQKSNELKSQTDKLLIMNQANSGENVVLTASLDDALGQVKSEVNTLKQIKAMP